jgi:GxxExxY protein
VRRFPVVQRDADRPGPARFHRGALRQNHGHPPPDCAHPAVRAAVHVPKRRAAGEQCRHSHKIPHERDVRERVQDHGPEKGESKGEKQGPDEHPKNVQRHGGRYHAASHPARRRPDNKLPGDSVQPAHVHEQHVRENPQKVQLRDTIHKQKARVGIREMASASRAVIQGLANEIYRNLGPGYSERVYHNAFEVILRKKGIQYESERVIPIMFMGHAIGNVRADLVIEGETVVELKSIKNLTSSTRIQVDNYMKLTGLKKGLLVNFQGPEEAGCEFEVCDTSGETAE